MLVDLDLPSDRVSERIAAVGEGARLHVFVGYPKMAEGGQASRAAGLNRVVSLGL